MKLFELFTIMELKDRIAHTAETRGRKIALKLLHTHDGSAKKMVRNEHEMLLAALEDAGFESLSDVKKIPADIDPELIQRLATKLLTKMADTDPSKNKKYLTWILNQWMSDALMLEDLPRISRVLEDWEAFSKGLKYEELEQAPLYVLNKNVQDINTWKDYRDLDKQLRKVKGSGRVAGVKVNNFVGRDDVQYMMQHRVPDPVETFGYAGDFDIDEYIENSEADGYGEDFDTHDWYDFGWSAADDAHATREIVPHYVSDKVAVLQPNTMRSACYLGKGTEWCTAYTDAENRFWEHAPQGPLYVIVTDKGHKMQWHFETGQFMDEHDDPVEREEMDAIISEYPELRDVFAKKAMEFGEAWLMKPENVTPEWVQQEIENATGWEGNKRAYTLVKLPRQMDGKADEKALTMIEDWIRGADRSNAWLYIRRPTLEDYLWSLRSMRSGDQGIPENIVKMMLEKMKATGVEPDERFWNEAVQSDPDGIWWMSPQQMLQNPELVVKAAYQHPRTIETATGWATKGVSYGSTPEPYEHEQGLAAVKALQSHPNGMKAILSGVYQDPEQPLYYGGMFGLDPWIKGWESVQQRPHLRRGYLTAFSNGNEIYTDIDFSQLAKAIQGAGLMTPEAMQAFYQQ